jgi:hypothetical protein
VNEDYIDLASDIVDELVEFITQYTGINTEWALLSDFEQDQALRAMKTIVEKYLM